MRIMNLIEDTPGKEGCLFEHGLSFYIETEKHKLLVDTGATDAFLRNAKVLGLDPQEIDTVILSHGHYDHGGGLLAFTEINDKAVIYLHENALGDFYSEKPDRTYYAGIEKQIGKLPQVKFVNEDMVIDEELFLFTNVTGRRHWPSGNLKLKEKVNDELVQDEFLHEQYLVIRAEGKEILMSGCAHNGILNILDRYINIIGNEPDLIISGFHMMKTGEYSEEEIETIRQTACELKKYKTKYYTGHCTGESAFKIMKEILGEQIEYIRSGQKLDV